MAGKKARNKVVGKIGKDVRKALHRGVAGTVIQDTVDQAMQKVADQADRPVKKATKVKVIQDKFLPGKTRKKIVDANAE
jgi:hypothetical protein